MPDSAIRTLRLDQNLRNRLDKLAKSTKRSHSFLAAEAIREYVALNDWQMNRFKKVPRRRTVVSLRPLSHRRKDVSLS